MIDRMVSEHLPAPASAPSWLADLRRIEWELAESLDFAPVTPDIEFVAYLRALSRFGYFTWGPITIDVAVVEDLLLRTHSHGDGGPDHPPVAPHYLDLTREVWLAVKRSGRTRADELHMLEVFMSWPDGLPRRVFGELGLTFEDVKKFHAELGGERPAPRATERLYSTDEAAAYLGVHVQTVRTWIRSGRLPASRLAGQKSIRIRQSDLEAVLEPIDPTSFDA